MKRREYHGHAHNGAVAAEYRAWQHMNKRCYDTKSKDYEHYGARGITVCAAWRGSFDAFLAHIGYRPSEAHTVERIDNNKGYKPGNVKWATRAEQSRNTRTNVRMTLDGVTLPLVDWAARLGMTKATLQERLYLGWSHRKALTTPVRAKAPERKLTAQDVRAIRRLWATGRYTQTELHKRFKTSNPSRISAIVNRRSWKAVS